jgi:hypothetical protein
VGCVEIQWEEGRRGNVVRETEGGGVGFGAMWSTKGHPAAAAAAASCGNTSDKSSSYVPLLSSPLLWGSIDREPESGGTALAPQLIRTHGKRANTIIAVHHQRLIKDQFRGCCRISHHGIFTYYYPFSRFSLRHSPQIQPAPPISNLV